MSDTFGMAWSPDAQVYAPVPRQRDLDAPHRAVRDRTSSLGGNGLAYLISARGPWSLWVCVTCQRASASVSHNRMFLSAPTGSRADILTAISRFLRMITLITLSGSG